MKLGVLVGLLAIALGASAQAPEYVRSEAMIPARDGVKLHVVILRPKDGIRMTFTKTIANDLYLAKTPSGFRTA